MRYGYSVVGQEQGTIGHPPLAERQRLVGRGKLERQRVPEQVQRSNGMLLAGLR
jgi:hypothetical protein